MIKSIEIENFKSIQKLKMDLGRVSILIGENGCGKSNILEAIALSSAAANNKLDNEFLASRGIRVTDPQFMRAAFDKENLTQKIKINLLGTDDNHFNCALGNDNTPYSEWSQAIEPLPVEFLEKIREKVEKKAIKEMTEEIVLEVFKEALEEIDPEVLRENIQNFEKNIVMPNLPNLHDFLIYSPKNPTLRIFEKEGQIQPLGINGEGLYKLLKVLSLDENKEKLNEIREKLHFIDWFKDFEIPGNSSENEKFIHIKDKYLDEEISYFDQKNSNEGFLFLLFYFSLFISDKTPKFFAVDNIDASLNPKLCSHLIKELIELAKKYDKQVILTTHNPAVLDGLNLDDPEQKLFVIYRNKSGHTKAKNFLKPETPEGQEPVRLSEAFMRGYIGGLPRGF
ncbi:MAG: ATP-binding protein [bacterium]|nr:ATP-binding protein [bacterium]